MKHRKYHVTVTESQRCDNNHIMVTSHGVTGHRSQHVTGSQLTNNMRTVRDKVHSYDSNCIYSVVNLTGTLLSSLCQTLNKEQLA